jgi:hypothetical protein
VKHFSRVLYMKINPVLEKYYQCQKDICKKEKGKETKLMDEILKNLNTPRNKCNRSLKILQSKFDIAFLREQQLLVIKTLNRNYIDKNDMKRLKGIINENLLVDKEFQELLACRKKYTLAKRKREICVQEMCGKDPFTKGGRTRKSRRRS